MAHGKWNATIALSAIIGFNVAPAFAQDSASAEGEALANGEIIVTAQRRSERVNDIPISITALQGDTLQNAGVVDPSSLVKLVPGLSHSETGRGTPTFYIRGVGFDEATLGANPSVALYLDEVPLAFPVEARFATLDAERVEVLKGPQGLLYGQNSTGGAINFIAAKPTAELSAGGSASFSRFNEFDLRGFVSGPVTSTLRARVAVLGITSDGWQKSYTRDDSLGAKRQLAGRLLFDWEPSDRLTASIALQGWKDKSDTLAGQLVGVAYFVPSGQGLAEVSNYPLAPNDARAADWNEDGRYRRNDDFVQGSVRLNYRVTDDIDLTSITAVTRFNQYFTLDADGTALQDPDITQTGFVRSFNQEIRLSGETGPVRWIVGGNYSRDKTGDFNRFVYNDGGVPLNLGYTSGDSFAEQAARNIAFFSNFDVSLSSDFMLHAGIRYTNDSRSSEACTKDTGAGDLAALFTGIASSVNGTPIIIPPGECITLNEDNLPSLIRGTLKEDNLSWRLGIDYRPSPDFLAYASVSKGYKAGAFPNINAASYIQLRSISQESVLAYETGIKASFANRLAQLNVAAFYYDYRDKQLRGRILDPVGIFGGLDTLVSIPKSRIWGFEGDLQLRPAQGLTAGVSATYVNSRVQGGYQGYDPFGALVSFDGLSFPHTPRWSIIAQVNYETPLSDKLNIFGGANFAYQSRTQALFNQPTVVAQYEGDPLNPDRRFAPDTFDVRPVQTVDAQLGFAEADDRWRLWLFARNIFDRYHWSNVALGLDTVYRLPMRPATYGISFSFKY